MKIQRGHCHVACWGSAVDVDPGCTMHRAGTAVAVLQPEHGPGLEAAGLVPILLCVLINCT